MDEAIVLYPLPTISHLLSMLELAKLIHARQASLHIHILLVSAPHSVSITASHISNVAATVSSFHFHHLPTVNLPSTITTTPHETLTSEERIRLSNPHVHQALVFISKTRTIKALIMDFFCFPSFSVAHQLKIPVFFFFTSAASCLALFLHLPTLHKNTTKSFKDLINTFLHVPGLPPLLSSDLPLPLLDRFHKSYVYFVDMVACFQTSAGIIVNTFEALELRAIKAISDGLCTPNITTPSVFCIGPLTVTENTSDSARDQSLTWLEAQPSKSVVFLSFGSLGLLSMEQLREIAIGLERSGQRFLWVVRNPPYNSQSLAISAQPDPDLNSLLPDGFLDRTKERGLVVKSWAPQVAILNHKSVGGFVTHCGWNSVLEAVCAGVPMVAWPLYAEQRFNKVMLVEEMKIALPVNETENGFVTAVEVEKRVTELLLSESGNSVRERIIVMKNEAKAALSEKGSSRVALRRLTESWNR